jgi:hypothetical protein
MKLIAGLKSTDVRIEGRSAAFTMLRALLALLFRGHTTFRFTVPPGYEIEIPDHAIVRTAGTSNAP